MKQRLAQPLRSGDRDDGQVAVREPVPERVLAGTVFLVAEGIHWAFCLSTQQEHQPGQATLTRELVPQLRVRRRRAVSHRGSVRNPMMAT